MEHLLDFVLHLDVHLGALVAEAGLWSYAVLFAVIFCETGLVVTPFLPGDSLLFAAGAVSALGHLNVHALAALLFVAAVVGDAVNYAAGRHLGLRVAGRWIKPAHLERTCAFYARHGGKTVVLARFVPSVRTFAPFVAGMGAMEYRRFLAYNVGGAAVWVGLFTYAGYFFGNIPAVKERFELVILGILALSVLPVLWGWLASRLQPRVAVAAD